MGHKPQDVDVIAAMERDRVSRDPEPKTGHDAFKPWFERPIPPPTEALKTLLREHLARKDGSALKAPLHVPFSNLKETNPKDAVGVRKVPFSVLPSQVLAEAGLGLLEGGRKYGRHNYRVAGIRASVYYDAQRRHMDKWWEGQDIDPDSGLHHVTKAICSLLVLRDAMLNGKVEDDRPPSVDEKIWGELDKLAGEIIDKYPDAKAPFVRAKP